MPDRTTPYGAFNFLVNLNGPIGEDQPLGGFSDQIITDEGNPNASTPERTRN